MGRPRIRVDGSVSGAGVPDIDRADLVPGETITLVDTNGINTGADYTGAWAIAAQPEEANAVLINPNTSSPSLLVPDSPYRPGTYIITCTIGGETGYTMAAVPLEHTGGRVPSFGEEIGRYTFRTPEGNTRNYVPAINSLLIALDTLCGQGSGMAPPDPVDPPLTPDEIFQMIINIGSPDSSDSTVPLSVGSFQLDIADFGDATLVDFRPIVAVGNTTVVGRVQLYNVTDNTVISNLSLSGVGATEPQVLSDADVLLNLPAGPKVYAVRIFVESTGNPGDTIEYWGTDLRIS